MDTTITARKIETVRPAMSDGYREALRLAARLLFARIISERNKKLCVCLEHVGDNGKCPVHG